MLRGPIGLLAGVAVASCIFAGAAEAQMAGADDPIFGVWKLNVERSVYYPGPRPPADLVNMRQYAPLPNGWRRFTSTSVNAAGNVTFGIGVYRLDGAQHPVHNVNTLSTEMTGGQPPSVMRSYRVIDDRTVEFFTYNNGVAGLPGVRVLAPDGMSFTQTIQGVNAQGVEVSSVTVWERVR